MFYVSPSEFVPSAADTKNLQIEMMRLSKQCIYVMCAHCDFNAFETLNFRRTCKLSGIQLWNLVKRQKFVICEIKKSHPEIRAAMH
jgi:hypothetical protein